MTLRKCIEYDLPVISKPNGNITFIEKSDYFPFNIERVNYLYDLTHNAIRGQHAHKQLHQFIIAISGSFDIKLDDGYSSEVFHLNSPKQGLYICPMIWREIYNFSPGTVLMVLASSQYDPNDYCHDYDTFINNVNKINS